MMRSLRCEGTAREVIRLRTTTNFFRDSPSPWVRFFGFRRCPTAICRSPYRFSSAPIVFTTTSSLKTSCCSATPPTFLAWPPKPWLPFSQAGSPSLCSNLAINFCWLVSLIAVNSMWPVSFLLGWFLFRPAGILSFVPTPECGDRASYYGLQSNHF
jgi:hypothetical protein